MGKRKVMAAAVFLILVLSGFLQEKWKIAVNFSLDYGDRIPGFFEMTPEEKQEAFLEVKKGLNRPHDYYYSHETPRILFQLDRSGLVVVKWALALGLLLYAAMMNALFISLWFGTKVYAKWLFALYGVALALAIVGFGILRLTGSPETGYLFSREILGALQSVLPSMLMLPGIWLYRHSSPESS